MALDPFETSAGLVIEGGAPRIFHRAARISVDVPESATRMRMAQDPLALQASPWEPAMSETIFTFNSILDRSTNTLNANGIHELFLQFSDSAGYESKVYKAITYIEVFPAEWREMVFVGPNVFIFNDGNIVSNKFLVEVNLVPPPNAVEVAIFEGIITAGGVISPVRDTKNFWQDVNQPLFHNFEYDGAKVLYVQFRDRDHALSPVYSNHVTIDPTYGFQDDLLWGYELAGQDIFCPEGTTSIGTTCLNTRWIFLELWPPETASKFAISEGNNPPGNLVYDFAWRTIPYPVNGRILIPYQIKGIGDRQINVHYRNFDDETLPYYTKNVQVKLNTASSFDFIEVSNVEADIYLQVDEDCNSFNCVKARTNTTNVWLKFTPPTFNRAINCPEQYAGDNSNGIYPNHDLDGWYTSFPRFEDEVTTEENTGETSEENTGETDEENDDIIVDDSVLYDPSHLLYQEERCQSNPAALSPATIRRVHVVNSLGQVTTKDVTTNETSVFIQPNATSEVKVEYLSADGVTISQTSAYYIKHDSGYRPPVPAQQAESN